MKGPEGKAQWKKELNRIKKRYGLRVSHLLSTFDFEKEM